MGNILTIPPVYGDTLTSQVGVFDDMADFAECCQTSPDTYYKSPYPDDFSGRGFPDAMTALTYGDTANVAAAEAFEREVEHLCDWSSRTFETVSDVFGTGLRFGAYAAGAPNMFKRRVRREAAAAPLNVVVAVNSASNVSTSQLVKRGTAIVALVRLLSVSRPVTLWASAVSRTDDDRANVGFAVKVDAAPLSLAHAAFILSDPAFGRRLSFIARNSVSGRRDMDFPPVTGNSEGAKAAGRLIFAAALGSDPADTLYIVRPHGNEPVISKPVAWLEAALRDFGRENDE